MKVHITSQRQLNDFEDSGKGWIVNKRDDRIQVHRAGCQAVGAMTQKYPKTWFSDSSEARAWLDQEFGYGTWTNCGFCGGIGSK